MCVYVYKYIYDQPLQQYLPILDIHGISGKNAQANARKNVIIIIIIIVIIRRRCFGGE